MCEFYPGQSCHFRPGVFELDFVLGQSGVFELDLVLGQWGWELQQLDRGVVSNTHLAFR